jgi:hypothetical protein
MLIFLFSSKVEQIWNPSSFLGPKNVDAEKHALIAQIIADLVAYCRMELMLRSLLHFLLKLIYKLTPANDPRLLAILHFVYF